MPERKGCWVLRPTSDLAKTFRGGHAGTPVLALHPSRPTQLGRAAPGRGAHGYTFPGGWGHVSSAHVRLQFRPADGDAVSLRLSLALWFFTGRASGLSLLRWRPPRRSALMRARLAPAPARPPPPHPPP